MAPSEFDAIVVGSGMTGGWAAKELTQKGLKVLVLERGRHIEHGGEEYTDFLDPWERENYGLYPEGWQDDMGLRSVGYAITPDNKKWFVRYEDDPYSFDDDKPFEWIRAHGLGGRSQLWSRQTWRMGEIDFAANKADGHGVPWPIGYNDLKPWYDYVEEFAGICGQAEGLEQVPDGVFQPPMELHAAEKVLQSKIEAAFPGRRVINSRMAHLTVPTEEQTELGRAACQKRNYCERGCSFGAFFSSLSATLPAAERTGNMTLETDMLVTNLIYDAKTRRATGVQAINTSTKQRQEFHAKMVFLCASAFASVNVLFNTISEDHAKGLGNRHDVLGRYITDHISNGEAEGTMPGLEDRYYEGRAPSGFYIPRYRNFTETGHGYLRGFALDCGAWREGWLRGAQQPGLGAAHKHALRKPGPWRVWLGGFGEMLPRWHNRITLHPTKTNQWGLAQLHIDVSPSENEINMSRQAGDDAAEMLEAAGCTDIETWHTVATPGSRIHEMGGAVMGDDPRRSVTNKFNQLHEAPNVLVTDGACFPSGGCQNPSISYMAMTARAAHNAVSMLQEGAL